MRRDRARDSAAAIATGCDDRQQAVRLPPDAEQRNRPRRLHEAARVVADEADRVVVQQWVEQLVEVVAPRALPEDVRHRARGLALEQVAVRRSHEIVSSATADQFGSGGGRFVPGSSSSVMTALSVV